jgi:hypothetical protein
VSANEDSSRHPVSRARGSRVHENRSCTTTHPVHADSSLLLSLAIAKDVGSLPSLRGLCHRNKAPRRERPISRPANRTSLFMSGRSLARGLPKPRSPPPTPIPPPQALSLSSKRLPVVVVRTDVLSVSSLGAFEESGSLTTAAEWIFTGFESGQEVNLGLRRREDDVFKKKTQRGLGGPLTLPATPRH